MIRKNVAYSPADFVKKQLKKETKVFHFYRTVFIILNVIVMILIATFASLTPILISKLIWKSYPDWYLITSAAITALSSLTISLLNFFYVSDKYREAQKNRMIIHTEIIKFMSNNQEYSSTKDREFQLFYNVTEKIGYLDSKENYG